MAKIFEFTPKISKTEDRERVLDTCKNEQNRNRKNLDQDVDFILSQKLMDPEVKQRIEFIRTLGETNIVTQQTMSVYSESFRGMTFCELFEILMNTDNIFIKKKPGYYLMLLSALNKRLKEVKERSKET